MQLENTFWFWNNAVGNKFCEDVIRFSKTLQKQKGVVIDSDGSGLLNTKTRKSEIIWMNEKWIYKELLTYITEANKLANYNFNLKEAEAIQYTRYSNNNYYDWHIDQIKNNNSKLERKLSIIINLTDPNDFEGGDVWVSNPHPESDKTQKIKLDFMRRRGSCVVFPSFVYHRVAPITKGTRHSLVCWMKGERFQ